MDWIVTIVGLTGFILAGKKIWWAWYVNLACQGLWVAYALITDQYAFLVAAAVYSIVFTKNALAWTKEHKEAKAAKQKSVDAGEPQLTYNQYRELWEASPPDEDDGEPYGEIFINSEAIKAGTVTVDDMSQMVLDWAVDRDYLVEFKIKYEARGTALQWFARSRIL